jgi:4-amino-4-deoxy-L-arabinose transferase-like glycosyltransferase
VVAAACIYQLDGYALLDPDEGRNAEVAREMAQSDDFVLPHLNGVPYLDKPVAFFATAAMLMKLFGPTVLAARLAPLLFTALALGVVAYFSRRLWGSGSSGTAVIATAATPFTLAYSRTVIFDSAVMLWVVAALLGFYAAVEARRNTRRGHGGVAELKQEEVSWRWSVMAWGAIGLGVLTKGPVVLALPLLIMVPYAVWRGAVAALFPPAGILFAVAIVLPWVLTVSNRVPGFLEYAALTETARRLTTDALGRTGPWWYFLVILPAAALPWTVVLAAALWTRRRSGHRAIDHRVILLALWVVVPLLFFSLSQSKRPQYVLPVVPAVGLAVAGIWHRREGRLPGVRAAAGALGLIGASLILLRSAIAGWIPDAPADVAAEIPPTATLLGLICIAAGVTAWVGARKLPLALLALSLPVASIPAVSLGLMRAIATDRSAVRIADAIRTIAGPRADVVGVGALPPSLPFYLGRTVTLATDDGTELTSNYATEHLPYLRQIPGTTLRDGEWWTEAVLECREGRVFVARNVDGAATRRLQTRLPLLLTTRKYAVFGPCRGGMLLGAVGSR